MAPGVWLIGQTLAVLIMSEQTKVSKGAPSRDAPDQNKKSWHPQTRPDIPKDSNSFARKLPPLLQGVPKKRTLRMLLEAQCTGSITSNRHPLCLEIFLVVSH